METRGGKREGSGRKAKAEELKLIEKLTPYESKAIELLFKKIDEEDMYALKMFFEYMYGKPKQQLDHTTDGKQMVIPNITYTVIEKEND